MQKPRNRYVSASADQGIGISAYRDTALAAPLLLIGWERMQVLLQDEAAPEEATVTEHQKEEPHDALGVLSLIRG